MSEDDLAAAAERVNDDVAKRSAERPPRDVALAAGQAAGDPLPTQFGHGGSPTESGETFSTTFAPPPETNVACRVAFGDLAAAIHSAFTTATTADDKPVRFWAAIAVDVTAITSTTSTASINNL